MPRALRIGPNLQGLREILLSLGSNVDRESISPVFTYLDDQLHDKVDDPKLRHSAVVSIVVLDGHGQINCYGRRISDGQLFRALNMSVGAHGSRVTGTVAYPDMKHLSSYQRGYFVSLGLCGGNDNEFVALVNVPCDSDKAIKYP